MVRTYSELVKYVQTFQRYTSEGNEPLRIKLAWWVETSVEIIVATGCA